MVAVSRSTVRSLVTDLPGKVFKPTVFNRDNDNDSDSGSDNDGDSGSDGDSDI